MRPPICQSCYWPSVNGIVIKHWRPNKRQIDAFQAFVKHFLLPLIAFFGRGAQIVSRNNRKIFNAPRSKRGFHQFFSVIVWFVDYRWIRQYEHKLSNLKNRYHYLANKQKLFLILCDDMFLNCLNCQSWYDDDK